MNINIDNRKTTTHTHTDTDRETKRDTERDTERPDTQRQTHRHTHTHRRNRGLGLLYKVVTTPPPRLSWLLLQASRNSNQTRPPTRTSLDPDGMSCSEFPRNYPQP